MQRPRANSTACIFRDRNLKFRVLGYYFGRERLGFVSPRYASQLSRLLLLITVHLVLAVRPIITRTQGGAKQLEGLFAKLNPGTSFAYQNFGSAPKFLQYEFTSTLKIARQLSLGYIDRSGIYRVWEQYCWKLWNFRYDKILTLWINLPYILFIIYFTLSFFCQPMLSTGANIPLGLPAIR